MVGPAEILPHCARRFGGKPALVTSTRTLTYDELDELSARVAAALAGRGLQPGDRVSLYAENRWEWVVAYHGILRAGYVVNSLNVMLAPPEVAYVVQDSQVAAIIGSPERLGAVARHRDELPALRALIAFDDPPAGCEPFDALIDRPGAPPAPPATDPTAVGSIGYTSGTTGHPKGAMQPHRAVLLNAALTAAMHGRHAGDVLVSALPLPHVYGNVAMHSIMLAGGTVVLARRFDAGRALELIEDHKATMLDGVPTMYAAMLAHDDLGRSDLSSLTGCAVGGQTMAVETIKEWEQRSGAPLLELWGMTEIAGLGTTHTLFAPPVPRSIGVSLPGVEIRVADLDESARTVAPGEAGELMVRGPIVMLGYWGNDEATGEALEPDGWLHTGDVATVDNTGHFFIVDRRKDMILTAGFNVYPAEIERVIATHPAVSLVAVGKEPDERKGELAMAYVVTRPGMTVAEDELIAHCRTQLAAYKLPRGVRFVDDLPMTSTGKIMRRELGRVHSDGATQRG